MYITFILFLVNEVSQNKNHVYRNHQNKIFVGLQSTKEVKISKKI